MRPADAPCSSDTCPDAVAATRARISDRSFFSLFLRVTPGLRDDPKAREQFWADVDEVMRPVLFPEQVERLPAAAPDPEATRASAPWEVVGGPTRWGPDRDSPRRARPRAIRSSTWSWPSPFAAEDRARTVGGLYDGAGVYRLRALAEEEGQ